MRFIFLIIYILTLPFNLLSQAKQINTVVTNLRCEYLTNPLGIDTPKPRFTWSYQSKNNFDQKKVRLIVSDNIDDINKGIGNIWEQEIKGNETLATFNSTIALKSYQKYYWRVFSWDDQNKKYSSDIAYFETAKMSQNEWISKWISDKNNKEYKPSPLFRKRFDIKKNIIKARLYITALGYYETWINGKRVGDKQLNPAYTHFDKRLYYSTYDITDLLHNGENTIGTVIGNGWFNIQSLAVWRFELAKWRQRPMMQCEIHLYYTDGSKDIVISDQSWKTAEGPYRFNNLYSGDIYDATLEHKDWLLANFNDSNWENAIVKKVNIPIIQADMFVPMRHANHLKPIKTDKISEKTYVFHFAENMAGTQRLKVKGKRGTKIKIRAGEELYPNGRLDLSTLAIYFQRETNDAPLKPIEGEEFQTNVYILKGDGWEEFTPNFNYHGFQYVEIESDNDIILHEDGLTAIQLHTDLRSVGSFSCSNPILNQLWQATRRSYLSNLHSIPTDCPQREKNGWTADAWVAIDLALLNYDGITIYEKWMRDFVDNIREDGRISGIIPSHDWGYADWIGPVWDAAMFIIPKALYQYYGDIKAIETIYPVCLQYLDYLKTREDENGLVTYGIGDWVPYDTKTPTDFTTSCYYYLDYKTMAEFAELLGKDPNPYRQKATQLKDKINKLYLDSKKNIYSNGSIAAQAVPLYLGIVPEHLETAIASNMMNIIREKEYKADFGLLGSKTVLRMMTKYGYVEEAYKMATQPEEPGWAIWMHKGMTTLAERWTQGEHPDFSYNHVFLGDISAWMVNTIAGINYDERKPGFNHFIIQPNYIKELNWAKGEYESINGVIKSNWKRTGKKIQLSISIPKNCSATVYINKDNKKELKGGDYTFNIET